MLDEKDLIKKAQIGDHLAFESLIETYQKQIYNHAYRMMNNAEDAADLAQDSLVKAFLNIAKFRSDSLFSTWLFRITHNVCLDEIRKRNKVTILPAELQPDVASLDPMPEEIYETKQVQGAILSALDQLTPAHKSVILLRDMEGYSYEEIAEITESTIGSVKSRISRGREQLKAILLKSNLIGTKYKQDSSKKVREVE